MFAGVKGVSFSYFPSADVVRHELGPGPDGALQVVLGLRPGLDQAGLRTVVTRIGEGLAADGEVRARIDALGFALRPADETG